MFQGSAPRPGGASSPTRPIRSCSRRNDFRAYWVGMSRRRSGRFPAYVLRAGRRRSTNYRNTTDSDLPEHGSDPKRSIHCTSKRPAGSMTGGPLHRSGLIQVEVAAGSFAGSRPKSSGLRHTSLVLAFP